MKIKNDIKNNKSYYIILSIIFIVAVLTRILYLTKFPQNLNADESFAGYHAYSLLNYGMDNFSYHFPVYFISIGSGMNALYSYITIPFIYFLGLNVFAIRLPQALFGVLTVYIFYKLMKELSNENRTFTLFATFIFAINPWHIMMSRWGLESNLVCAFLILGLYFFILGLKNNKYLILSAIFYGLCLYCYATIWPILPIILILQIVYGIYIKAIKLNRYLIISIIVFTVIAIPIFLFILVNLSMIPEIKTNFISIPRLLYMRKSELGGGFSQIIINFKEFIKLMVFQNDNLSWSTTNNFGMYYYITTPFIVVGLILIIYRSIKAIKNREVDKNNNYLIVFVLIQIIAAIPMMFLICNVNVNKINNIHIPLIICGIYGVYYLSNLISKHFLKITTLIYLISFIFFIAAYINTPPYFQSSRKDAIEYIKQQGANDKIVNVYDTFYSNFLFDTQFPTDEFVRTVKYNNYDKDTWDYSEFLFVLSINSFGNYRFDKPISEGVNLGEVYIFDKNNASLLNIFEKEGKQLKTIGDVYVYIP